jgi:purine-nucleoside phosphorylase
MSRHPHAIAAELLVHHVEAAAESIASRWANTPRVGVILGTGLGEFAREIVVEQSLPYGEIPHFPQSTAPGHSGRLTCGTIGDVPIVAMEGRSHVYEGYPAWQITLPVRVMRRLGIDTLIVSNAAGGLNSYYREGDVMAIVDHINLLWANPLMGETNEALGDRFPDMSCPYDIDLIEQAAAIARREDFALHRGVYIALSGPNYETRAEYRMLRRIGGDVVGMSTVPEVIVAAQLGLRVLALSTITNVCLPDALGETDGDAVVAAAAAAEHKLRAIVRSVIRTIDDETGD